MSLSFFGCHENLTRHDLLVREFEDAAGRDDTETADRLWAEIQANGARRAELINEALSLVASLGVSVSDIETRYSRLIRELGF